VTNYYGISIEDLKNAQLTPDEELLEKTYQQYRLLKMTMGDSLSTSMSDFREPPTDFNLFSTEENMEPVTLKEVLTEGWNWVFSRALLASVVLFGYTIYVYRKEEITPQHRFVFSPFLNTIKGIETAAKNLHRMVVDPPVSKLLPDLPKLPPGYQLPKTLVLDLRGTLVSSEYSLGVGFEVKRRPGLTEFLSKMSQMYEVVLFSDEDFQFTHMTAENIETKQRVFQARLSREHMCLRSGELIKDLSFLNRDLKNVIILEKDPKKVKFHPDNVILVPEFTGDSSDKALIELIPFLEHVAKDQRIKDVREELNKFGHSDTGKKYIEHLRKIRDQISTQQSKGVSGLLTKMGQKRPSQQQFSDVTDETPKPPVK
jgi:import inner membrane translocase subunit TIM50